MKVSDHSAYHRARRAAQRGDYANPHPEGSEDHRIYQTGLNSIGQHEANEEESFWMRCAHLREASDTLAARINAMRKEDRA